MRLIDANKLKITDTWALVEKDPKDGNTEDNNAFTFAPLKCVLLSDIENAPTIEITEEQAIDKLHETGWIIRHDKEMTERPQGKWIPVSERLPDIDGYYLVSFEDEQILVAHSSSIIEHHDFEPKMLAWQPLPEPYKKGGAE